MGLKRCGNLIYITDLNITTEYRAIQPDIHYARVRKSKLIGTARYININGHLKFNKLNFIYYIYIF